MRDVKKGGDPPSVPNSLRQEGETLEVLLWTTRALNLLERVPSCSLKESLRTDLVLVQEGNPQETSAALHDQIQNLLMDNANLSLRVENLESELNAFVDNFDVSNPSVRDLIRPYVNERKHYALWFGLIIGSVSVGFISLIISLLH